MKDDLKASNDECKNLAKDLRKADCNGRSPARNCAELVGKVDTCKTFVNTKQQKEMVVKQVLDG
jgi:hypothetical protein